MKRNLITLIALFGFTTGASAGINGDLGNFERIWAVPETTSHVPSEQGRDQKPVYEFVL
jgi:hypothetical protein